MSTCTDLIDAINAVVNPPNNFNDISASCSALSLSGSNSLVQLSGGGNAVLSAPSAAIDGRVFTVKIAGKISSASGAGGPQFYGTLYLGNSTGGPQVGTTISPSSSGTTANACVFYSTFTGVWDSVSQKVLIGNTVGTCSSAYSSGITDLSVAPASFSASAYSSVKFCFAGQYNNFTSGSPVLTLTQFSFEYA